jgi:hypothetical protein
MWTVCPQADDGTYDAMFVDRLVLGETAYDEPTLTYDYYSFIFTCKESAMAKAMRNHGISLNWNSSWARRARSSDHAHAIIYAISSWLPEYGSSTLVGEEYCMQDSGAPNYLSTNCSTAFGAGHTFIEAAYGTDGSGHRGAFCSNQNNGGTHRAYEDPNSVLGGAWTDLDLCDDIADVATAAAAHDITDYVVVWARD